MTLQNKLILCFPKSGSNLLSRLHANQGYHNFGSFFDTFRYSLVENDGVPYSRKMTLQQQLQIRLTRFERGQTIDDWTHLLMTKSRLKKFNKLQPEKPSIVTVNMPTFDYAPEAVNLFNDREVLCVRRADKFTQILMRCEEITKISSGGASRIKIDKSFFEFSFHMLMKLESLQNYCVDSGMGRVVNLEGILEGKENLGFSYAITEPAPVVVSTVTNVPELQKAFNSLAKKYNVRWEA
jgi:hypothetical protein